MTAIAVIHKRDTETKGGNVKKEKKVFLSFSFTLMTAIAVIQKETQETKGDSG